MILFLMTFMLCCVMVAGIGSRVGCPLCSRPEKDCECHRHD